MAERRLVTLHGKTLSISEWAKFVGISRQRAYALYSEGRLESYICGIKRTPGRRSGVQEKIKEALKTPHTTAEVCRIAGYSNTTFFRYVKANNVINKDGKYVELD